MVVTNRIGALILEIGDYIVEKGEFEIFVGDNCLTNNSVTITII